MIKFDARHTRPMGTIETFYEDASVAGDNSGLTVDTMTASVMSGHAVAITSQTYSTTNEELSYTVNFQNRGSGVIRVQTTFDSSDQVATSIYKFTVSDDGTGYPLEDYV